MIEASFYNEGVDCSTLNLVVRVRSVMRKYDLDFFLFSYYIWWPVQGWHPWSCCAKQVLGCHSKPARHLYWYMYKCIQMSCYRKEEYSSLDINYTSTAGFYSHAVECRTLNLAIWFQSPVWENCDLFFLLAYLNNKQKRN